MARKIRFNVISNWPLHDELTLDDEWKVMRVEQTRTDQIRIIVMRDPRPPSG